MEEVDGANWEEGGSEMEEVDEANWEEEGSEVEEVDDEEEEERSGASVEKDDEERVEPVMDREEEVNEGTEGNKASGEGYLEGFENGMINEDGVEEGWIEDK
ncbi:hypothetical protein CgunFtcFv8_006124 [Champsocephalus gunnari]|uniref:Uncharacterized protein n=1 Tax=Champsocephalus gunnari TaxID=52237 RepID=A0AAN8BXS0_CHAGU|nr:hypothetical protein CgunFtcFv8_006124 [Champsocephalus gunnari]